MFLSSIGLTSHHNQYEFNDMYSYSNLFIKVNKSLIVKLYFFEVVMELNLTKCLPELLTKQQQVVWPEVEFRLEQQQTVLTNKQLSLLKKAVSLSDFIYKNTLQIPHLVAEIITSNTLLENIDYRLLLQQKLAQIDDETSFYRTIRQFRNQQMVGIAVADLVLNCPLTLSLAKLSDLADALILESLAWLSQFYQQKWGVPVNASGEEQPLLVYAMGKLGGKELNFSSDIDLIFAYPEAGETTGVRRVLSNQQYFIRLAQKLISALNQTTADGFVFRVDMRLRPFGESGPLVMSFNAMEDYYQEQGRDWERYAMLKARLVGEGKYHRQLATMLRPFVYRRYIDFSVIDSLRKMKLMIAQEVRRKNLINNIKLGAGGIREIEFIVQVFQLLRGGQIQELQQRHLLSVLPLLVKHQIISKVSAENFSQAYCFLRRVENIIQAFDDKQTQTLPDDELSQQRLIFILGIATWSDFLEKLQGYMQQVHTEFTLLIGEETPSTEVCNNAFDEYWLSIEHWTDEEIEHWLVNQSINWQLQQCQTVQEFKRAISKHSVGQRGRNILDKLMPLLLWHLSAQNCSNEIITRVLTIIEKIMSRTAYLELLFENEGALKQLIKLCKESLWISEHIAKYPILLDELINPELLNSPPELSSYSEELKLWLLRIPEDDLEAQMNCLRQFKQVQQLRIAAADIVDVLPVTKVSDHLTAVAEAILQEVINISWQHITQRYGVPEEIEKLSHKGFAVIGYGKLGGIELGYSSDLDLVFIHQCNIQAFTNGDKPILVGQFYAKLVQRMMHVFNTRMTSGILYELDMRLRPSGNSGVAVVHIDSFQQYQLQEAWTWEHQALVRSRIVYGNSEIACRFQKIKQQVLMLPRESESLKNDVISMRIKMREHLDKSTTEKIDLKQAEGGLVDIEFICQYLVLLNCAQHPSLSEFSDNIRIFEQLAQVNIISERDKNTLINSYCYLRDLGHHATLNHSARQQVSNDALACLSNVQALWQKVFDL
jgi:glutamate-ammonia-ligase adenylyltransferase